MHDETTQTEPEPQAEPELEPAADEPADDDEAGTAETADDE